MNIDGIELTKTRGLNDKQTTTEQTWKHKLNKPMHLKHEQVWFRLHILTRLAATVFASPCNVCQDLLRFQRPLSTHFWGLRLHTRRGPHQIGRAHV